MVGFAVVVVAPLAVLWLAIVSVDRASPEYLGRCDPGSTSLVSAAGGLIWATIDLLLIYAVVVWFIERRRRLEADRGAGWPVLVGVGAVLFAVLCVFGYVVIFGMSTTAFCIPF